MAMRVYGVLAKSEESMQRSLYSFFLAVLLCNVLFQVPASAQTGRGTIAGTAKDEANSALSSALIEIQALGRRAVSDDQGQFRIADVPAGEYTLTVSYVGFAQFSSTVKVDAGQTANVNAVLKIASVSDQVMVTAERARGEAEAISRVVFKFCSARRHGSRRGAELFRWQNSGSAISLGQQGANSILHLA